MPVVVRKICYSLLCVIVCIAIPNGPSKGKGKSIYHIIVHETNTTPPLSRKEVSLLFLKKKKEWPDGKHVMPVDLVQDSSVRVRFSLDIHNKKMSQLRAYWQRRIFTGTDVPPPEKTTDQDVLKYIQSNPSAIGYISAETKISDYDVRKLELKD